MVEVFRVILPLPELKTQNYVACNQHIKELVRILAVVLTHKIPFHLDQQNF